MLALIRRYWTIIRRPSVHFSLGFLTVGGFIGGIVFWGAFNTAMESTNTETFCTGCHEMHDNPYADLKSTIHYTNRSGVRAMCSNCHVPHEWTDKMARKMQASKEVWGKIFGTIDTPEKFEAKRLELAQPRMGAFQGERLAGMPQLSQLRLHGLHATERPRARTCIRLTWQTRKRPASTATRALRTGSPTSRRVRRLPILLGRSYRRKTPKRRRRRSVVRANS